MRLENSRLSVVTVHRLAGWKKHMDIRSSRDCQRALREGKERYRATLNGEGRVASMS